MLVKSHDFEQTASKQALPLSFLLQHESQGTRARQNEGRQNEGKLPNW